MMEQRFIRNIPSVSGEEQRALRGKRVLVAGCGGLGGYLIEYLARMGVGGMTVVDGDVFEASNLNRQLLSTPALLGTSKARAAAERVRQIDSKISVQAVEVYLNEENADELVAGHDLALDGLDSVAARLILEDACAREGVCLVHGAIQGWMAQITVVPPGDGALHRIYGGPSRPGDRTSLPFTPPLCAAVQAAEAVKLLCGRESTLTGKLLLVDLKNMDWEMMLV